jgi:hypothetical protein
MFRVGLHTSLARLKLARILCGLKVIHTEGADLHYRFFPLNDEGRNKARQRGNRK